MGVDSSRSNKKTNKVLVSIFSLSTVLQITVFLATMMIGENLPDMTPGIIVGLISPVIIFLLTPIVTVHLYMKKDLFEYKSSTIARSGLFAYFVTAPIVVVETIVHFSVLEGGISALSDTLVLLVVLLMVFALLGLCAMALAGLFLETIIYMRIIKKIRGKKNGTAF